MPPKKLKKTQCYDWVPSIPDASLITARHRRAAAGLTGQLQCSFPYSSLPTPGPSTLSDNGSDVVITKDTGCTAGKCKKNPRCYNQIGVAEVIRAKKEEWIEDQLGDGPAIRVEDQPAGLRNLGATCYANAFLQIWYRNVVFRNGVYKAAQTAKPDTPIHHLAILFASLQYSARAVVDPTPLIDSLGLKKGDQQDAAEFSKLFISLVNDAFARSPDPTVRNTVNDLFEGSLVNVNTCSRCKTASSSQQPLLELDLPLKEKSNTVERCLADLHAVEDLTGDNQYYCHVCKSKQNAERSTYIKNMPPYLNLCLMRFTYERGRRIKSKATIRYKKELPVGDLQYKLCAVVVHVGTSAHHGHFKCDVWDEESESWIVCNDEVIEKPEKNKRRKPDPDKAGDDYISCNQAYMLVYKRDGEVAAKEPASNTMAKVAEDNVELGKEITERRRQVEIADDNWGHLQGAKMDVIRSLPGTDHVVPRAQLQAWLGAKTVDDLWAEWDYSEVQCQHGWIAPKQGDLCRLISEEAFDKLSVYASGLPEIDVCGTCVAAEYERHKSSNSLAKSIITFDKLNEEGDGAYLLPRDWLNAWRKGEVGTTLPTDALYSIICEHDARWDAGIKTVTISGEAAALLQSLFGDFKVFPTGAPSCGECAEATQGRREAEEEAMMAGKLEYKLHSRGIRPAYPHPPFDVPYVMLPRGWGKAWNATVKSGKDCPVPWDVGLCQHGGLSWDPAVEGPEWADESAFLAMCQRYGDQPRVEIVFGPNTLPGKKFNVALLNPDVCDTCNRERLSTMENAWITIKFGKPGDRQIVTDRRGSTRSRNGAKASYQLQISGDMTVKDLQLDILHDKQLSPIYQLLRHRDRELTEPDKTLGELGIVAHDEVWCEVLEDNDDFEMLDGPVEEGFGGTALVGSIECPQCTLVNPGGTMACDACGMEFAF